MALNKGEPEARARAFVADRAAILQRTYSRERRERLAFEAEAKLSVCPGPTVFPAVASTTLGRSDPEAPAQGQGPSLTNDSIRVAVEMWCANPTECALTYGHIRTWDTHAVTDMALLFQNKDAMNDDLSNWDTRNVCRVVYTYAWASMYGHV